MIFFILAGGYGERAKPLSLIKPKPIFPVNGQPLIRIMLKQLKDIGLKKGLINLHYMPEKIKKNIKNEKKEKIKNKKRKKRNKKEKKKKKEKREKKRKNKK